MATQKIKASDRQTVCKKLIVDLKKKYKGNFYKSNHTVLETVLFSVCLENATYQQAEAAFEKLLSGFHDLNEIRVSSISEIRPVFEGMSDPDWRAMKVRDVLQYIFEAQYKFEWEALKKKTNDQAEKLLKKIKSLSPFSHGYVLLESLGAHVVPVDDAMTRFALWIGMAEPKEKIRIVGDHFKSGVRKADSQTLFFLVHALANDPKYKELLDLLATKEEDSEVVPGEKHRLFSAVKLVKDLLAGKIKKPRKKPTPKPKPKKATAKKATAKKSTAKKSTKKKTEPKKTTKKKTATKKTTAKKVAKKTAVKKKAATKKVTKKAVKKTVKKAVKKAAKKTAKKTVKKTTKKAAKKKAVKKKTTKKKSSKK